MRFILFEDSGKVVVGKQRSAGPASSQVELESGKHVKVKTAQILLTFDAMNSHDWLAAVQALADNIDVALVWEFAPDDEFGFVQLALDYFGATPNVQEKAAMLLCLRAAPHYFRRIGKGGNFKKSDAQTVQQALRAIEKRKQVQAQIDQWAQSLQQGVCPDPIQAQTYKILFKPDKNSPEYKAVVQAAQAEKISVLALLQKAGAIGSAYDWHWQRFLWEHFPQGLAFPPDCVQDKVATQEDLPLAPVHAFSIDDSSTTEIDDALSVQSLDNGSMRVGVHIACPAFGISPDDKVDALARTRLSTVYIPGGKVTMLPPAIIQAYTLDAGQTRVVLSLYTDWDENQHDCLGHTTVLERIFVSDNLRLQELEPQIECDTEGNLLTTDGIPYAKELQRLYQLACSLKAAREAKRGKPENQNRPEYYFEVLKSDPTGFPKGNENVQIHTRQRGAPLDLIVAECMILANSTWGAWLQTSGVPAIYRSQASLLPGVKVRMGTKPLPHAGIGVACYAWSTSPLRRYIDLVNQWQLLAALQYGNSAALVAPFGAGNNSTLLSIIHTFEATYTAYNTFQSTMERYWTLQYLHQNHIQQLEATVLRDGLVRANTLPLVLSIAQIQNLERGAQVLLALNTIDNVTLAVDASMLKVLEHATATVQCDEDIHCTTDSQALAATVDNAVDTAAAMQDTSLEGMYNQQPHNSLIPYGESNYVKRLE